MKELSEGDLETIRRALLDRQEKHVGRLLDLDPIARDHANQTTSFHAKEKLPSGIPVEVKLHHSVIKNLCKKFPMGR